ncbi:hypothetical protein PP182_03065 [Maribacter sp. PR1]|uniref:DUF4252 domain-containing protein n=1 Tax=Maribacter cobaltidurans TaxID=1178778 RepID=A0ABU7IPZ8_9FLAO|nr:MULTISPECIES: hypothetical protein [Maribacter]MDC6387646.1 hypothetical protein [Maribacter sp. PR1]MEE1975034.1 hypothetical protein [Maribacter cobaltidurans]
MKALLIIFFVSVLFLPIDVQEARELYPMAIDDAEVADSLYKKLTAINLENNATLYGYKGAAYTLKAKHAKGIKEKKTYFKEGVAMIESAIALDPENVELRFVRLSVQENAPKIVNYREDLESDKSFILKKYPQIKDPTIKELIKKYSKDSKVFSEEEKATL